MYILLHDLELIWSAYYSLYCTVKVIIRSLCVPWLDEEDFVSLTTLTSTILEIEHFYEQFPSDIQRCTFIPAY